MNLPFGFGISIGDQSGDKPMELPNLASLICCTLVSFMTTRSLMKVPIKSPPLILMMLLCCCCSCSSSATLVSDTRKRVGV